MQDLRLQLFKLRNKKKMLNPFEPVAQFWQFFPIIITRKFAHYGLWSDARGTQREYSSKPLKHGIVKPILVFER